MGLTVLYLNAVWQQKVAEQREMGARTVSMLSEEHVLAAARPDEWAGGVGKDGTPKQALNQAGLKFVEAFAGQPVLNAAVRDTLGTTHYLSENDTAAEHLTKGHTLRVEHMEPDHP